MCIHTHSRYPCRSVICESLSFFIFLFERYLYAIMSANSRQYILEMNIFFNKLPLLYRIHLCYTVREMNDMQNRIICVKCSANGELSPKRKVRLTVYDPHPLQQYKRISHIVLGYVFRHTFYHNWRYLFHFNTLSARQKKDNLHSTRYHV